MRKEYIGGYTRVWESWRPTQNSACAQALSRVQLFFAPWAVARQAPRPKGFSGKNTRAGCHFLLQEIFPTRGWNLCLLHCQADSLPLHHKGSPEFCLNLHKLSVPWEDVTLFGMWFLQELTMSMLDIHTTFLVSRFLDFPPIFSFHFLCFFLSLFYSYLMWKTAYIHKSVWSTLQGIICLYLSSIFLLSSYWFLWLLYMIWMFALWQLFVLQTSPVLFPIFSVF